jgi:hypothetical protein
MESGVRVMGRTWSVASVVAMGCGLCMCPVMDRPVNPLFCMRDRGLPSHGRVPAWRHDGWCGGPNYRLLT